MSPLKVCFISLKSYPLFAKNSNAYFGGAEVQMSLIAKELSKDRRFTVNLITGNYGQGRIVRKNRLTLYRTQLWDFFLILRQINADIYIERTINPKVLLVGWWCKIFKKKFVYMIAHDWDCRHRLITLADRIIAQHHGQQRLIKTRFGRDSDLFPPLSMPAGSPIRPAIKRQEILWVGRADAWKQPGLFTDLARRYPKEKFIMVCRPGQLKFAPPPLPNLQFIPAVAWADIRKVFARAKLLVNTSAAEGWPNTFLQAGAAGIPVLSYRVNPDGYLNRYRCGWVGRRLPRLNHRFGLNHYRYVKNHHGRKNLNIFKQILYRL